MPPKKKLTRYEAAYDHLGRGGGLGFTKKAIRAKIDSLLKVYGADGWIFIEDCSYKMLIECLLEEQEQLPLQGKEVEEENQEEKEENYQQNKKLKEKEEEEEEDDQKSEEQLPRKIFSLSEIEKRIARTGRFSSNAETSKVESEKRITENGRSVAETSKVESEKRITENGRFTSVAETSNTIEVPEPTEVEMTEPTGTETPQQRIRRPCFGFYDSDDDGEDDCEENYVYYETKASVRERMDRARLVNPRKERKSRWDVVGV